MNTDSNDGHPVADAVRRIREGWIATQVEDTWSVATPFMGPDLNQIELLIDGSASEGYVVSDGGYVADYFFMSGRALDEDESLAQHVAEVAARLGASVDEESLWLDASADRLGEALVFMTQAVLSLPELWDRPRERTHQLSFRAKVGRETLRMALHVEEALEVGGLVEQHRFDLGVRHNGSILGIQTLSTKKRSRAHELRRLMAWDMVDIRDAQVDLEMAVLIDDSSPRRRTAVPDSVIEPLRKMGGTVMRWSALEREDYRDLRQAVEAALSEPVST